MADKTKNLPATVKAAVAPQKKTKKQITLAVSRVLKKQKFSPLEELIRDVYPQLNPEKQADVLLRLCTYLYPAVKAADVGPRKKGPGIQINTQVVTSQPQEQQQQPRVTPPPPTPSITMEDLMRIAVSDADDETK